MMKAMRALLKSKLSALVFGIVILSMAVWGVEDIFSNSLRGNIAKAGDRTLSVAEFERSVDNYIRDESVQRGKAFTKAEAISSGAVDQIFAQQSYRTMILGYADKIGATASTNAVKQEALKIDAFRDQLTGEFDRDAYRRALSNARLTAREYEQSERDRLTSGYLDAATTAAIQPPTILAELQAIYQGEARTVTAFEINVLDAADEIEPTEEQLLTFYEENKAGFSEPERRAVSVLFMSPEDFRTSVEIAEETLQSTYEAGKTTRYASPSSRRFTEAYFTTEAEALRALGSLAAGGDAAALDGVITTAERTALKDEIANQELAEQLFTQMTGAVAGPVQFEDEWVVARIEEVIPGEPSPFEDVRDQIEGELITREAQRAYGDAAFNLDNLIGEGLTIVEIGKRLNVPVFSYAPTDQRGLTESREVMAGLAQYQEGFSEASTLFEEEIGQTFEVDGGSYIVQLDKIVPPSTPAFEDIKSRVEAAWKASQQGEKLRTLGDTIVTRISSEGSTLEREAEKLGKTVISSERPMTRTNYDIGLPINAVSAAFNANEGDVVSVPTDRPGSYIILRVDSVQPPSGDMLDALQAPARTQVAVALENDVMAALSGEIIEAIDLETNDGALAAYKNRTVDQ